MRYVWRFLAVVLLVVVLFIVVAPGFLFTEDAERKADVVVLFIGPGNEARMYEARQLVRDGYARYLLIPSWGQIFAADSKGGLVQINASQPRENLFLTIRKAAIYGKHCENTHIEALEAKRMMDEMGLRSALLVSSAYHMRRIRLIAARVFHGQNYSYSCIPAHWQTEYTVADWFLKPHRHNIASEYVKIAWFLVYAPFRGST